MTPNNTREGKCNGAHCKCMDIGGECGNTHFYHCKEHNPNATPKHGDHSDYAPPQQESWERELKKMQDLKYEEFELKGVYDDSWVESFIRKTHADLLERVAYIVEKDEIEVPHYYGNPRTEEMVYVKDVLAVINNIKKE